MMNNAFDENIFGSLDSDMKKSDLEYVVTSPVSRENVMVGNFIEGRILGVSSDATCKRLIITKIIEKLFYGQKMSDCCNTIVVRCPQGEYVKDVHIYYYGYLPGGVSELKVGAVLKARGRMDSRGRYMAKELEVDGVSVRSQFELKDILFWPILILLLIGIPILSSIDYASLGEGISELFVMKEIIYFLFGFGITSKIMRRFCRYYIPFGVRIKRCLIAGVISMLGMGFIL